MGGEVNNAKCEVQSAKYEEQSAEYFCVAVKLCKSI
jgi:hypothetical protein